MILHPCPYCGIRSQLPEIGRCEDPECMKKHRAAEKSDAARCDPTGTMLRAGVPPMWLVPIRPAEYLVEHKDQLIVTNDWRHGGFCLANALRLHVEETGTDSVKWIEGAEIGHLRPEDVYDFMQELLACKALAVNSLRLLEDAGLIAGLARMRQPLGLVTFISTMTTEADLTEFGVRRLLENVGLRDMYHVVVSYPE